MIETQDSLRDCLAPAKLNLFLHITGRRPNGYHDLQTVFQLLDWGDTLHFTRRRDGRITRTVEVEGVPAEDDLTVRAAAGDMQEEIEFRGREAVAQRVLSFDHDACGEPGAITGRARA